MKLFKIKAETAGRILNVWTKTYTFDKDAICIMPEEDVLWLPLNYKNLWEAWEKNDWIPMEEIKKVVEPELEIEKVVETELDIEKDIIENTPVAKIKKGAKTDVVKK